jgi:hypothetical protein
VRSDIISAIEREDFSRIPPKAYTKNMISSYARIVGVDPEAVTSLYLDEAYSKSLSKTRSEMDRFNRINERIVNRSEATEYGSRPYTSSSEVRSSAQSRYEAASRSSERLGRTLYSARDDYPDPHDQYQHHADDKMFDVAFSDFNHFVFLSCSLYVSIITQAEPFVNRKLKIISGFFIFGILHKRPKKKSCNLYILHKTARLGRSRAVEKRGLSPPLLFH